MKKIIILIGFILNHYIGDDIKAHKSESSMNPQQSPIETPLQNETSEKNKTHNNNLSIIGSILGFLLGYGLYKLKNDPKNEDLTKVKNDQSYEGLMKKINKLFSENKKNKGRYSLIKRTDTFIEILDELFVFDISHPNSEFHHIELFIRKDSISLYFITVDRNVESLKQTLRKTLTKMEQHQEYKDNEYILKLIKFTIRLIDFAIKHNYDFDNVNINGENLQYSICELEYIKITEQINQKDLNTADALVDIAAGLINNSQLTTVWKK